MNWDSASESKPVESTITLATEKCDPPDSRPMFKPGQRVHFAADCQRIGTVRYVGSVQGYSGEWVGVDWDNGDGKHDGSLSGVRYFQAACEKSASFVRPQNLSPGISALDALTIRYQGECTKEEEDEMYVLSSSNKKVSVEFVGKDKIQKKFSHFEELTSASLAFLGVSSPGHPGELRSAAPNLKALDLTGNLLSEWKDVGAICGELPKLATLNLSKNNMSQDITCLPVLQNIRILVLSFTGIKWAQIELIKYYLPVIEELHLVGNEISEITLTASLVVQGLESLRILNMEENCLSDWDEILKLRYMPSLEQLYLNKNSLSCITYPCGDSSDETSCDKPFQNLKCLLLGANSLDDLHSVDSLNSFPSLRDNNIKFELRGKIYESIPAVITNVEPEAPFYADIRLSENPVSDPARGGIPRFVLIARLAKVEVLNGSEVSPRERKESEIRYARLVMSKLQGNLEEITREHPRFFELKRLHGLEDERPSNGTQGPQKMATSLISVTLKCVGASMGEKPPLKKKLPATTSVGKLINLCESFFRLKSVKLKLFLEEEGSPFPILLDDEMTSLLDVGVGQDSTILVDEES